MANEDYHIFAKTIFKTFNISFLLRSKITKMAIYLKKKILFTAFLQIQKSFSEKIYNFTIMDSDFA